MSCLPIRDSSAYRFGSEPISTLLMLNTNYYNPTFYFHTNISTNISTYLLSSENHQCRPKPKPTTTNHNMALHTPKENASAAEPSSDSKKSVSTSMITAKNSAKMSSLATLIAEKLKKPMKPSGSKCLALKKRYEICKNSLWYILFVFIISLCIHFVFYIILANIYLQKSPNNPQ